MVRPAGAPDVAGSVYAGVDARASEIVDRAHWLPRPLQYPYAASARWRPTSPVATGSPSTATTAEYTAATVVVANSATTARA